MEVSFISFILCTFCLSLHNFAPVYPIALMYTLNECQCYGDSLDIQDNVITTMHSKMASLETNMV